jgi:hypothetical protein
MPWSRKQRRLSSAPPNQIDIDKLFELVMHDVRFYYKSIVTSLGNHASGHLTQKRICHWRYIR